MQLNLCYFLMFLSAMYLLCFPSLLEEILCYINVVAHSVEENADNPTAKFWRALLNRSYDVLDKVGYL